MIRIKFIIEDIKLKARSFSNSVYFDQLDKETIDLIENQRLLLSRRRTNGNNSRIFCLIENVGEEK